jgi:hypothetical protein
MIRPARSGHAFLLIFPGILALYRPANFVIAQPGNPGLRRGYASLRRLRSSQQRRDFDGVHYSIFD